MLESNPKGISVDHQDKSFLPPGERDKRESFLREVIGFSSEKMAKLREKRPSLYSIGSMTDKIAGLQERGFTKPHKMIEVLPANLDYSFENIDAKIAGLQERGFTKPHKMIEWAPPILGFAFENIDAKIAGLQERGFTKPHKMIESFPPIFSHSFENIDAKIAGLQERGFTKPHKMIESFPPILGLGFENIDGKIKLLSRLNNLYDLKLNPISTFESNLTILGVKFKKLIVIARVLREYKPLVEDIQRKFSHIYKINLECLLVSYSKKQPSDTIDELTRTARNIQKEKLSKEDKRQLIKDFFKDDPESSKIYRDYLRGYPEKESAN